MTTINNFAEIRNIFQEFPTACTESETLVREREKTLTKPMGSLGELENISLHYARWQGKSNISLTHPRVAVFAGNHGVARQGVSAYPSEVTAQMVQNFQQQGAAINQLCKMTNADLRVYEMRLQYPTHDFTEMPAMSESDCVNAIAYGMTTVEPGIDTLCVGEMGIGNSTSGAAMAYALFGGNPVNWTGFGTGVSSDTYAHKIAIVEKAVKLHKDNMTINSKIDGLKVLQHLGGYELCAIVGAIIAARMARVPVIIDGYTCSVAAAILYSYAPTYMAHCLFGHVSAEPSHIRLLDMMNKRALLDFGMRLGEASGATLALAIVQGAIRCHTDMATFAEAKISNKNF